jgi:hypothetical protein
MRAQPLITPMHRGRLPTCSCRHRFAVAGPERPSGRNAYPCGITPSTIMSPTRSQSGPWTEIRPGARAHTRSDSASTAPVKRFALGPAGRPRGDRAPPPALDQQSRVTSATPNNNNNPDAAACADVPAQIRSIPDACHDRTAPYHARGAVVRLRKCARGPFVHVWRSSVLVRRRGGPTVLEEAYRRLRSHRTDR